MGREGGLPWNGLAPHSKGVSLGTAATAAKAAATATAATADELSQPIQAPSPRRAGIKYPVRVNPSLRFYSCMPWDWGLDGLGKFVHRRRRRLDPIFASNWLKVIKTNVTEKCFGLLIFQHTSKNHSKCSIPKSSGHHEWIRVEVLPLESVLRVWKGHSRSISGLMLSLFL